MSQENVEIVRRTIELWSRGDVDGALKLAGDDFVMDLVELNRSCKGDLPWERRGPRILDHLCPRPLRG
jgi:ketosteroid isomerase-like protein